MFAVTYRVGERLISAPAGLVAVALLAAQPFAFWAGQMNNPMLAALLVAFSALCLARFHEQRDDCTPPPSAQCSG